MGFNYAPPPTTFAPKGLIAGATISALGDSISARGGYFPVGASTASVPAWAPSTSNVVGALLLSGGLLYRCTVAGTSAVSGGPTGQAQSGIADGTATWAFVPFSQNRTIDSYLHWTEVFSGGALKWNMAQGYAGISGSMIKALIAAPGAGYAQGDLVTWAGGARGYLNVAAGVPQSITITNPGYASTTGFGVPTITTAGGSGCVVSNVSQVAGTFGVPGCTTADMVARLPDCVASTVDIFVVLGGTNDLGAGVSFAAITANLKTCYEVLIGAGKRVIAAPILPRSVGGETTAQLALLQRVNRWIRAYARREAWANPNQIIVGLADPTRYFTDGASSVGKPVGAATAGNGAMTVDGLHPSARGAQYLAMAITAAAQGMGMAIPPQPYARTATQNDGYHRTLNPGGNYLEAQPWAATTAVQVGDTCLNSPYLYICTTAGTTGASSAPAGTGSGITDGTAGWKYMRRAGSSVFATGAANAVPASSGGYTTSGTTDAGWSLYHIANGAATGTVSAAVETPWSDGQPGQRQSLAFALTGGANTEQWELYCISQAWTASDYGNLGILQADLGVTAFIFEVELDVSNLANVTQISTLVQDGTTSFAFRYQTGFGAYPGGGASCTLMKSAGEMLGLPNNGRLLLRSDPFVLPAAPILISNLTIGIFFGFDPSSSAASLNAKINHAALRRAWRA